MDLTEDPNFLTPEQADVDFYLNAIEQSYVSLMQNFGNYGAQVTRIVLIRLPLLMMNGI